MIYFLQAGEDGPIKIGYAKSIRHIQHRIESFKTGCPWPIRLLSYVEGDRGTESLLHQKFANYRTHGEWFLPTPLLTDIASKAHRARFLIDHVEADKRWCESGLVDKKGRFTDSGRSHLFHLELFAAEHLDWDFIMEMAASGASWLGK